MMGLNELCAVKVMGWRLNPHYGNKQHYPYQMYERPNMDAIPTHEFQPSSRLDDSLLCLEKARNGHSLDMRYVTEAYASKWHKDKRWIVAVKTRGHPRAEAREDSLILAMCVCALRACNVKEDEIQAALQLAS